MADAPPFYVDPSDPPSKQGVLKAALRLFAREGVRESSIRSVAAEAGFTNPVLFKYFKSKDALALHLFERCYLRLVREVTGALRGTDGFRPKLGRLVRRLLELLDESPEAVLFVNEELRRFWPLVSSATRRHSILGLTAAFLDEHLPAKRAVSTKLLVAGFWGLMAQFARLHAFNEWPGAAVDAAPEVEALVLRMLQS